MNKQDPNQVKHPKFKMEPIKRKVQSIPFCKQINH